MTGISKYYRKEGEVEQAARRFWQWFVENEHRFRELEKNDSDQALSFLEELIQQMQPFNPYLKALAGPDNNGNYELIITSDGDIALFSKVEELVKAAPEVPNWVFTAHKPALGFEGISIDLYGLQFTTATTSFYPIVQEDYPDEVTIVITHTGYNKELDDQFQAGGMIYLENGLGEVNTATKIDNYETGPVPPASEGIEVIPISKLNDYLNWREKEFVEKYESVPAERPDTYHLLEAEDKDGKKMLLTVNMECRYWDKKPAYSWLLQVNINYTGDENGFPFKEQLIELQTLEEELFSLLPGDRTILAGNKTYDNCRNIYFYVSDYRTTAALLNRYVETKETVYEIIFFIRRDKYWRTMEQYFNLPIED
ncbi:DUF695 domain-containing protein [Longitalea arenae]|uniref:DUF695 domain-containing protein n=1 Tax=Longitalea arenae TaxID=2812558 RepID=UPI001967CA9B|nr:DUF695 domain-containing protein [Longitalea arenae]